MTERAWNPDPAWAFVVEGYPYDDDTPEETVRAVIRDWEDDYQPGIKMKPLESLIIATLTYKAYYAGDVSGLRWIDPDGEWQKRLDLSTTDA